MSLLFKTDVTRNRGRRSSAVHLRSLALSAAGALCLNNSVHGQHSGGIYSLGVSTDAQVRFAWKPNAEPDLAGYKLYVGTLPRMYTGSIDLGLVTEFELPGLVRGMRYYFALTAYTSMGVESDFTPELSWEAPVPGDTMETPSPSLLNSPPAITSIADHVLPKNQPSDPILFSISDAETSTSALRVAASSSNPSVLPESGVIISGFETDRILIINPANGRTGRSIVTISISDGFATTTTSFVVTIEQRLDAYVDQ